MKHCGLFLSVADDFGAMLTEPAATTTVVRDSDDLP
jgi:hypothetical protein